MAAQGSALECLRDYVQRAGDQAYAKRVLAVFTHVEPLTVERWLGGVHGPKGEQLVRLRSFLEFLGYQLIELQGFPEINLQLARWLAFGLVGFEEVQQTLDYKNLDAVYGLTIRGNGLQQHRLFRMNRMVAKYEAALKHAQAEWEQVIDGEIQPEQVQSFTITSDPLAPRDHPANIHRTRRSGAPVQPSLPMAQPPASPPPSSEEGLLADAFVGAVFAACRIVQSAESDVMSADTQQALLEVVGIDNVRELIVVLQTMAE